MKYRQIRGILVDFDVFLPFFYSKIGTFLQKCSIFGHIFRHFSSICKKKYANFSVFEKHKKVIKSPTFTSEIDFFFTPIFKTKNYFFYFCVFFSFDKNLTLFGTPKQLF
jgi:hypothetical protein